MKRILLLVAVFLLLGAAPATASTLDPQWGASAPSDTVQILPRDGSRLIVQPMQVSLIAPEPLSSVRFSMTDGCGRTVRLDPVAVRGPAATVLLPGQRAAVGGWHVRWTAVSRSGVSSSGGSAFEVVNGYGCDGRSLTGAATHHTNELAAQLRATDDAGDGPARHPVTAAVLAVLLGLVLVGGSARLLRGVDSPADLTALVLIQSAVIGVASAGGGTATWVRFALAVPTGLLVTVLAVRAAGRFRSWPVRSLVAGLAAGSTTAAVAAVWAMGRSALFVIAPLETFHGYTDLVVATAVAAAVLCAGGWYGRSSSSDPEPALPVEV